LKDALLRSLRVADAIGIRAFFVHAKDSDAAAFYSRFGFLSSPTDPLHLMLLLKDMRFADLCIADAGRHALKMRSSGPCKLS
jgi:hypothetical protein